MVHERGIIHKDINPGNIVRNIETGQIKLIDFGISSMLRRESVEAQAARGFHGAPAYMSPEQTGRMNVALDYRTDLYSLGVTFYEVLTGKLPFVATDRLELVHAHIARTPLAPNDVDPDVPQVLSDIVMRLLEKRAEDRYQSARGLKHDLELCRQQLSDKGRVGAFELRKRDVEDRLALPQKLYGRRRETAMLVGAFQRVAAGGTEVLLVAGYSGIGKTSLVNEVQRPILECRGTFASGKCDQFNRGVPYDSIAQAIRSFVRHVMREDEAVQRNWRERILNAVGANGRVLTDLLYEVEQIIGPQPPVEVITSTEAENRMVRTMRQFVRAIAGSRHPLVLFLDDLQWADLPSLKLIQSLARDFQTNHVLFVGAYRDNEIDESHPVAQFVRELNEANVVVRDIKLGPLSSNDAKLLLADTTSLPPEDVAPLAELCIEKTDGNPFFLNRFLEALYEGGQLRLNKTTARWEWDVEQIAAQEITDNVVDFMCKKIETLSHVTRQALLMAAVIGNTFDLRTLALLLGHDMRQAQSDLREALDEDLVRPIGSKYWESSGGEVSNFRFRFLHDRIQQAAYSLLPDRSRRSTHLRLGRLLLTHLSEEERSHQLFDIVEHLHQAVDLITEREQRDEISRLNYDAGKRALQSAAYTPAFHYLERAANLSGENMWERDYEYALNVSVESARAAYLSGRGSAMDERIDRVLVHAKTPLDLSRAREIRILSLVGKRELPAAIDLALDTLEILGRPLTANPTSEDVEKGLAATLALLGDRSNEALSALPLGEDRTVQAAMQLEILISAAAFLARPLLLPLLAFDLVKSSVEVGIARQSAYGFGLFGLYLAAINVCDVAFKQAQLSLQLLDRFGDRALRPRPSHLIYGFTNIWSMPLRETLEQEREVWFVGMDTGDIEYACWGIQLYLANSFWSGKKLGTLQSEFDTYVTAAKELQQEAVVHVMVQVQQAVENLVGNAEDPRRLVGPGFHEDEAIENYKAINYRGGVAVTYAMAAKVRYLFGDYAGAAEASAIGSTYGDGVAATFMLVSFRFYGALASLKLCDGATADKQAELLAIADGHLSAIETWARFCVANHAHRVALIDAERARVVGDIVTAIDRYDDAIELARTNGFVQHEALANELAGRFFTNRGRNVIGRAYLMEARFAYQRWGASAMVDRLEGEFPGLSAVELAPSTGKSLTTTVHVTRVAQSDMTMDVQSLFKATTALASEMRLDALLDKVLDVAIQNAGATHGYLLTDYAGELRVEAAEDADGEKICKKGTPYADAEGLPSGVVSHVFAKGEPLVLEDARLDERFADELDDKPRSILCLPLAYHGKRSGIVYLENRLTAGAFTPDRLTVLELLSTQAAVAIENARLYEETRAMAVSFERFVPKEFLAPLGRERVVDLAIGDAATHQITALFIDLRGFTALFEKLDPKDGFKLLNEYFGRMSPIVAKHKGIVIQFLGDGIMASFMGAADAAVQAVIDMVRSLEEMNAAPVVAGAGKLKLGAGLHAGPVLLATVGSAGRLDVTAIGDTVNCAARVEAATKALGAPVLITEEVMWRMMRPKDFDLRELGEMRVYGRKEPLALVEVFGGDEDEIRAGKRATLETFTGALASYRSGRYDEAATAFASCIDTCPEDGVAQVMLSRARQRVEAGPGALVKGDVELV